MSFSTIARVGPDGKVYCQHKEEAMKRRSHTPKHPNRDFYCCKRPLGSQDRCSFWVWADEVPPRVKDQTAAPGPSTPSPLDELKDAVSMNRRPIPATPTQLQQNGCAPPNNSLSRQSSLRKRIQDIDVGLKQREQDLTLARYPGSSKETEGHTSSNGSEAVPQPPSPVPTEVDDEPETQPEPFRSFLGLHYSPQAGVLSVKDEEQPSSPKKPRFTPATEDSGQAVTEAVSLGGGVPLTPPQTVRRAARLGERRSPVARNGKGKEREGIRRVQAQDQGGRVQTAGSSREPKEEDALPLFTLAEDASSITVSPSIAENVLEYTDGLRARVKVLSEYLDSFDITRAVRSLQTVERQKMQFECRDRSQKKRMEELTAEVSRLKEALERDAEIAALKMR